MTGLLYFLDIGARNIFSMLNVVIQQLVYEQNITIIRIY